MSGYTHNPERSNGTQDNESESLARLELRKYDSPAIVDLDDGRTELYINHTILESGWLRVQTRGDRTTRKYPPSQVARVEKISTVIEDGTHRIDDDGAVLEFLGKRAGWA